MSCRVRLLSGAALAGLVLWAAAPPTVAWHAAGHPAGADPTSAVTAVAALLSWAIASWLAVSALLVLAGALPGCVGRLARLGSRRVAPRALRAGLAVLLGVGVGSSTGGVVARAAAPVPAPLPAVASLAGWDWPLPEGGASPTPAPDAAPIAAHPALAAPPAAPPIGDVLVRPGDSLWQIARSHLPSGAPAVAVARTWPAWWHANRGTVGPDPNLLHPGTELRPPG